jgi:hypothetical protein
MLVLLTFSCRLIPLLVQDAQQSIISRQSRISLLVPSEPLIYFGNPPYATRTIFSLTP